MKKQFVRLAFLLTAIASVCGCSSSSSSDILAVEPVKVYFMSVTAAPLASESITLRNNSGEAVDISGWTLGNQANPSAYTVPNGIAINQGATRTFPHFVLGFQIADSGETLSLKDASGVLVDSWTN